MKLQKTLIAAALAAFAAPVAAQQVTFMTGPQGGSWIPLGGALKGMWEKAVPGLNITQTPGAGIANVRGVDEGKAQIGFANSSTTVDGLEGRPPDLVEGAGGSAPLAGPVDRPGHDAGHMGRHPDGAPGMGR